MSIFELPIHERVTRATVDALLRGEALAIWIKGLLPPEHCEHVYERVRAAPLRPQLVPYTRDDGSPAYHAYANLTRVGVDAQLDQYFDRLSATRALPEAERRPAVAAIMDEYLASVSAANQANDALCAPYRRPCDLLFEHLFEARGLRVSEFDGRRMKFGTFRLDRRAERPDDAAGIPIHVDAVPSTLFPSIEAQLEAMVYCRAPRLGGELRVYDHPLVPPDAPMPPGVDHTTAYRALKPLAGDALLINSRRPHAMIPGVDEDRLANIMFIGSSGDQPLQTWT
ncbi:MAG: hypothetical protein JWM10_437 [Myxococcaceae bacterium]|nr:hypothetical protein [Myxococcaceae bacterium]